MTAAAGVEHGRASADWLALREPADAVARSAQLVEELIPLLRSELLGFVGPARSADRAKPTNPSNSGRQAGADREGWDHRAALTVHDLGSGTGSQRRWLAPRLPCPQRWVEHDRDAALLPTSLVSSPRAPSELLGFDSARSVDRAKPTNPSESQGFGPGGVQDGGCIEEVTRCTCDLAELTAEHLEQADLITASALLDVLTGSTLDRLISAGAGLRVPMLLTLSVVGRVRLAPADPFDPEVMAAFNDHQRRDTATGRLLGPDAVAYATRRCRDLGATVRSAPSPWLLGSSTEPNDDRGRALMATWFTGWLDAAVEQRPELAARSGDYRRRRMTEVATGRLEVVVEHTDLLVWWP